MSDNSQPVQLPKFFVGHLTAQERVVKFQERKHKILSDLLPKTEGQPSRVETKHIWYSIDHIETLLDEMRRLNADGIRIYFGAYNDDEGNNADGQLCLIMVPTRTILQGDTSTPTHEDVILESEPDFESRYNATFPNAENTQERVHSEDKVSIENEIKEKRFIPRHQAKEIKGLKSFNQGSPCPPDCPEDGVKYGIESIS